MDRAPSSCRYNRQTRAIRPGYTLEIVPAWRQGHAVGGPSMQSRRAVLLWCFLVMSGCHTPRLDEIDHCVDDLASRPFDVAPITAPEAPDPRPSPSDATPGGGGGRREAADPPRPAADLVPAAFSQVERGAG